MERFSSAAVRKCDNSAFSSEKLLKTADELLAGLTHVECDLAGERPTRIYVEQGQNFLCVHLRGRIGLPCVWCIDAQHIQLSEVSFLPAHFHTRLTAEGGRARSQ